MILEIAKIDVKEGSEVAFVRAASAGVDIFRRAKGCRGMTIQQSKEASTAFVLLVKWETLENHIVDFRNSEDVKQWRALIADYLVAPLSISNYEVVVEGF